MHKTHSPKVGQHAFALRRKAMGRWVVDHECSADQKAPGHNTQSTFAIEIAFLYPRVHTGPVTPIFTCGLVVTEAEEFGIMRARMIAQVKGEVADIDRAIDSFGLGT